MFCKYCGAKIDDDSAFCTACGRNLTESSRTQQANVNDTAEAEETTTESYVEIYQREKDSQWYYYDDEKKRGPVTTEELVLLINSNQITEPNTRLCKVTEDPEWVTLKDTFLITPFLNKHGISSDRKHLNENIDLYRKARTENISDKWMWTLALLPLFVPLLCLFISRSIFFVSATAQICIHILLNCIILAVDINYLKSHGHMASNWLFLGFVLIPIYMGVRASKTNKNYGPLILWCCLFVLFVWQLIKPIYIIF